MIERGFGMDKDVTIILGGSDKGHFSLFKRYLQRWGFEYPIMRFADSQGILDFLHRAREGDCRLSDRMYILMISMMSFSTRQMDGLAVLKAMKKDPDFKNIPMLMLTDVEDPKNITDCLDAGCDAILSLPLKKEAFIRVMNNIGVIKMSPSIG
ncbi:MAG: response regulator [Planctomycetes bacterium]|nr:response regulator [Planctomycetota bacterium]